MSQNCIEILVFAWSYIRLLKKQTNDVCTFLGNGFFSASFQIFFLRSLKISRLTVTSALLSQALCLIWD